VYIKHCLPPLLVVNGIIPHTSCTYHSQQVMSPETCQKRYSFQQSHQRNNLRPSHRSISSLKSRKSCQSNEQSNLPNGTARHRNSAGISKDKDTVTKSNGKTGMERQDKVWSDQPPSEPILVARSPNLQSEPTAPLDAPINVPSHRMFNLWSRISFISGDSPQSQSETSSPNEISKY
jgi:hypothetical protein